MSGVSQTPPGPDKKGNMPLIEEQPVEGQEDTSTRAERIRVKNRRKLYLDRHPSYFTSPDLELAGAYTV